MEKRVAKVATLKINFGIITYVHIFITTWTNDFS